VKIILHEGMVRIQLAQDGSVGSSGNNNEASDSTENNFLISELLLARQVWLWSADVCMRCHFTCLKCDKESIWQE
jgi:hypothetical protein